MNAIGWLVAGLLIGGGIGAVGAWLWFRGKAQGPSYQALKKEQEEFKKDVTDHFVQTAQLINQLTDSYKAVFDHMSEGADKLVEPETLRQRLPVTGDNEIRLRRIGAGRGNRKRNDEADSDDPIGI